MNSSGSAMEENAKWLDSIEGKSTKLTNAMQAIWNNTLNSDMIKTFYDIALGATEVVDAIGLLPTVLAGVLIYFKAFKGIGIGSVFKDFGTSVQSYAVAMQQVSQIQSLNLGMTNTGMLNVQSVNAYSQALAGLSAKQQAAILTSAGLEKAHIAQVLAQNKVEPATIRQIVGLEALNKVQQASTAIKFADARATLEKQGITLSDATATWLADNATKELTKDEVLKAATMLMSKGATEEEIVALLGLAGASGTASAGIKGVSKALWTMMASNHIGWIIALVSGVVLLTTKIKQSKEETVRAAEEASRTYKEAQKTLQDQKKTIDELSASYERLSKGVDLDTNDNINLTTKSYEEYLNICNEIADMYPHLVTGFDSQGNAILSLKGNVDELIQAYHEAAQVARQKIIASGDDIFNTFKTTYDHDGIWDDGISQEIEYAKSLIDAFNSNDIDKMQEALDKYVDGYGNFSASFKKMLDNAGLKTQDLYEFEAFKGQVVNIDEWKKAIPLLQLFVKTSTPAINTETSKVKSLMDAYLGEDLNYASYSNQIRSWIDQIISGLNAEFINRFDSANSLYNWIKTNIVDAFEDPDVTDAVMNLSNLQLQFADGDIAYTTYVKQLNEYLLDLYNKVDSEAYAQIKVAIGIDKESLQTDVEHIKGILKDTVLDRDLKIARLSVEDLQIAGELEVPEGVLYTWDELIEKIKEAKIAATQDFDITDHTEAITSHSAAISEFQEAIQKLGKGSFTMDDFMDLIGKYPKLAKGVDVSSNAFYGLSRNLNRAIKANTKSFIKDLKNLKTSLLAAGKSTESIDQLIEAVENMPDNALDDTIERYQTLADEIDRARLAQDRLLSSMEENPNEGYENRGEAMEYMKEAMKRGEIGSESNLWNVAEKYGFTYDSAKTINENADALAEYIAIRETWFKQDDDGNYTYDGTENFIESVEKIVEESEAAGTRLAEILTWDYDETTGTFAFDFDNKDLPEIISLLSQTKELVGLTEQEWMDLMVQVGQYFGINWGDYQDAKDYLDGIVNGTSDAKTKVEEYGKAMQDYFGKDTEIDLSNREIVSGDAIRDAGWKFDGKESTLFSQVDAGNADGTIQIVATPVLPDGKVLNEEKFNSYIEQIAAGTDPAEIQFEFEGKNYTGDDIFLKKFEGKDALEQASQYHMLLGEVLNQYNQLRDRLNIGATLDESGLEGLYEKFKNYETKFIDKNSDGTVLIDEEAFKAALIKAEYTEDQIDRLIKKIKEVNGESFNIDNFNIDDALDKNGIEELKKVKELQNAIKEDANTGLTIFDTDMFASVLRDAGYTGTKIDELIKKIQEYDGVVSVAGNTDPLGFDYMNNQLGNAQVDIDTLKASLSTLGVSFKEGLGALGDGKYDIKIEVADLVTVLKEKNWTPEEIKNYITALNNSENEGYTITVNGIESIDEVIETANKVPENEQIAVEITGTALTDAQAINSELNKMQDKTVNVTLTETTVKKTEDKTSGSKTNPNNIPSYAAQSGMSDDYYFDSATRTWKKKIGRVNGTAHAQGSWGAPKTETSLVGELGPELLVRGNRWTTVGDNGAEFTQVKKGDIIFNHKQTESLLKNGYVTGRGKAYASGNAFSEGGGTFARYEFSGSGGYTKYDVNDKVVDSFGDLSGAVSDATDSADDFKESLDWIEVRLEELDEDLGMLNAQLENAVYYTEKNNKIDEIIAKNREKMANLEAGADYYESYIDKFWNKIPAEFREAAQNGAIAITDFAGEPSEEVVEAIQSYRDYVQKAADLRQQKEETKTEIRDLAIQKFDNAYAAGDVRATVEDSQTEKLQNAVDYDETRGLITSDAYYVAMMENSNKKIEYLTNARKAMQEELDRAVKAGEIARGSNEWYELLDQMYQVDAQIDEATTELEEFQNAINDLYWENFDQLINRLDYLKDETQSLIDLMDSEDMVTKPEGKTYEGGTVKYWTEDDVKWTDEGLASLGLYAQQMEIAEYQARQYAKAIDDLTKDYKKGLYSENEYIEKLEELKDGQYENIEAYYDAQDAIVDLNKTRVDSIKDGVQKEIDAFEELIEAKKKALDAEKDLYDFQKDTAEQQKNIAQIERQLAALANDHSLSAMARRKQLESELAEATYNLQDTFYNRSVEDKQTALDQELETFQQEKDAELIKWDEYLTNVETLVAESLGIVQANAAEIGQTLTDKANEYNLTVSDAILTPWQDGSMAVSGYQSTFDTAMSSTMNQLEALKNKWQEVIDKMAEAGKANVVAINKENANYAAATYKQPVENKPSSSAPATTQKQEPQYSTYTVKSGDNLSTIAQKQLGSASKWQDIYNLNKDIIKNPNLIYPGWKLKLPKYAKGTTGIGKNQLALIDELGEELVMHADGSGRLAFLSKGSAVIPHDISENLMQLGSLDPSDVLSRSTPQIGVHPEIHNTEVNITMEIAEVVHIDKVTQDTIPDLTKAVRKEMDSYMLKVNNAIKAKVR